MKFLVTGGAGYVGSPTVKALLDQGHEVVVYDNLSTGLSEALHKGIRFHLGDIRDSALLSRIVKDSKVDGIFHFASQRDVVESTRDPLSVYETNVFGLHGVAKAMASNNVKFLVFASSAEVYGDGTTQDPIREQIEQRPLNPFGQTMKICEQILRDVDSTYGIRSAVLRYFQVGGASEAGHLGPQRSHGSLDWVANAAKTAVGHQQARIEVNQMTTPADGFPVRDFIHVDDIVEINLRAMEHLRSGQTSFDLNCGTGKGHSIQQLILEMSKVSGKQIQLHKIENQQRWASVLIADPSKLKALLGFTQEFRSFESICKSAYHWEAR